MTQAGLACSLGRPSFHSFITVGYTLGANDMRQGPCPQGSQDRLGRTHEPWSTVGTGHCLAERGYGPDSLSLRAGLCSPGVCSHCRQPGAWMPQGAAPLLQGSPSYVTPLGITSVSGDISLLQWNGNVHTEDKLWPRIASGQGRFYSWHEAVFPPETCFSVVWNWACRWGTWACMHQQFSVAGKLWTSLCVHEKSLGRAPAALCSRSPALRI